MPSLAAGPISRPALPSPYGDQSVFSLAPYYIVRVGALPLRTLDIFGESQVSRIIEKVLDLSALLARDRTLVSELLHQIIGNELDPIRRRAGLAVRRTLFNARAPREQDWMTVRGMLHGDSPVIAYHATVLSLTELSACLDDAVVTALASERRQLGSIVCDPAILNGIALSSPSLYDAFIRQSDAALGRELRLDRALLRYVTRAAGKATPFSTFCITDFGAWSHNARTWTRPDRCAGITRNTHVHPNKRLYAALWHLICLDASIRPHLQLEVARSIHRLENEYQFISISEGREVVQHLGTDDCIDTIARLISERGSITYSALVRAIVAYDTLDTTAEEARDYIDALIACGFMRFAQPVSDQESDWLEPLASVLPECGDSSIKVREAIASLRSVVASYEAKNAGERHRALIDARERVRLAFEALGGSFIPPGLDLLVYEDLSGSLPLDVRDVPANSLPYTTLSRYLAATTALAHPRAEMMTLRAFFDQTYTHSSQVPLLRFYEDAFRDFLREHLQAERAGAAIRRDGAERGNPFALESIREIRRASHAVTELFRDAWRSKPDAESLSVGVNEIEDLCADLVSANRTRSVSMFAQLLTRPDGRNSVFMPTGRYSIGYGKYFSRFVNMFPGSADRVASSNASLHADLLAEISGDSSFNGNLHPPLLPYVLNYPTANPSTDRLAIDRTDVVVAADPADPKSLVLLAASTGQRITPVDVGFLNPQLRPPLFRLLARFQPAAHFALNLPEVLDSQQVGITRRRPRLCIDDQVVVARQTWMVPRSDWPSMQKGETMGRFMLRFSRWRRHHAIPSKGYLRFRLRPSSAAFQVRPTKVDQKESELAARAEARVTNPTRQSSDWHKPQFVDFRSPLLLSLIGAPNVGQREFDVFIEECWPDCTFAPRLQDEPYSSEFILEFQRTERANG